MQQNFNKWYGDVESRFEKEVRIFMKAGFSELQAKVLCLVRMADLGTLEYLSAKVDEFLEKNNENA